MTDTDHDPVETAWHIHAALVDWTGKVDSKASFALAIESALIAGLINLSEEGAIFDSLSGFWQHATYWLGSVLLVGAVLFAVSVVTPQLRRSKVAREWQSGLIYFGHLRRWDDADALATALEGRDMLPVLSQQLINMSDIAWQKHGHMQFSVLCALVGALLLSMCAILVAT